MKTLAIETSCDDTSLWIINDENGIFTVEKLIAYSQIQEHNQYGGVLPEIASRLHSEKIVRLLQEIGWEEIKKVDFISVTTHPWLPGSLIVGKAAAHLLSAYFQKPLKEIHHIHGHLFSLLLEKKKEDLIFPMVVLTASGGHNDIYLVQKEQHSELTEYEQLNDFLIYKIGYTLDDAAWEAFDKVSKMLGGPYPWGPWISSEAGKGKPNEAFHFKRIFLPMKDEKFFEFSFSGMKSQVSFLLDKREKEGKSLTDQEISDLAFEFQEAMVETLGKRLLKAAKLYGAKMIGITGGVSANQRLIDYLQTEIQSLSGIQFIYPKKKVYSTDNAAMIGVVGLLS